MKNMKTRGFSPLIIVLAIAAILAIGYKLYVGPKNNQTPGENNQSSTTSQTGSDNAENPIGQTTSPSNTSGSVKPSSLTPATSLNTYKNNTYGFEIKYPSSWPKPVESVSREIGPKFELKISFRNSFSDTASAKGFDIKIYKTQLNVSRVETQTDDLLPTASLTKNQNYDSTCGVFATSVVKEVYFTSGDKCFKEAYFFTLFRNNIIYNIIPVPKGGIGYAGYDGAAKAKTDLPELGKIVNSFYFFK